jgi:hypothetical protein
MIDANGREKFRSVLKEHGLKCEIEGLKRLKDPDKILDFIEGKTI